MYFYGLVLSHVIVNWDNVREDVAIASKESRDFIRFLF
jgi:hypothetical protein